MKKLLLLLPLFLLVLLAGCPQFFSEYKIYYYGTGATEGKAPVDEKKYHPGDRITVLDQGTLKNGDYAFLGWKTSSYYYDNYYDADYPDDAAPPPDSDPYHYDYPPYYLTPDSKINMGWENIYMYAVWDDGSDSPFVYKANEEYVTISGYKPESCWYSYVYIPETIQGKPVTVIDSTAFINLSISELRLAKNLKQIGAGAFSKNEIRMLTIPDSVESIGMGAFRENSLISVVFGKGLKAIESHVFSNNKLANIVIPENIKTIGSGAFLGNDILFVRIGSDVDIKDDTAIGTYGDSFRKAYDKQQKASGLYQYNRAENTWEK